MSIKEDIRSGNIKGAYLLWGEENFLKDYYKKALVSKVLHDDFADFNYMEIVSEKPDADKVSDFVNSYPFMGDKKVLFIKNSELFKKTTEAEKDFWKSVLSDVSDYLIIIFSENEVNKTNAIYKAMAKGHSIDEFAFQSEANLCDWIRRYSESLGKSISPKASLHLIKSCSQSMYILKGEIDKLSAYCDERKEITIEDIELCSCKIPEDKVFDMIDSLILGNKNDAFKKYDELKQLRQEPLRIVSAIYLKLNGLKKIKILAPTMNSYQIAEKIKQKEYFVSKDILKVRNITLKKLDEILYLCQEADHRIKTDFVDGWAMLDIIIAKMA